jgi:crotonobetainyl-CoA:carnitine CoA-transferase CaiB-like acyl-CoA transferase
MSKTPGGIETPAPKVGQHNEEIFGRLLGLSMEEIGELKEEKVV